MKFQWSGWNSFKARRTAAQQLRSELSQIVAGRPHDRYYFICHSHGGNVAQAAIAGTELEPRIASICLSTPFLHVRPRPMAPKEPLAITILSWVVIALAAVTITDLYVRWDWQPVVSIPIGVVFISVAIWVGVQLVFRVSVADQILQEILKTQSSHPRLLIVRTSADEASGVLIAAQFASWLTRKMSEVAGAPSRFIYASGELLYICFLFAGALLVPAAGAVMRLLGFRPFGRALDNSSQSFALFGGLLIVVVFMWGTVLNLVSLPISLCCSFVSTAFGLEACLTTSVLDISAEPSPPGEWIIHQLPLHEEEELSKYITPSVTDEHQRMPVKGLMHSKSYDDPRVMRLIASYVNKWEHSAERTGKSVIWEGAPIQESS